MNNQHLKIVQSLEQLLSNMLLPKYLARIAIKVPKPLNYSIVEYLLNLVFNEQILEGEFDFLQSHLVQIELIDAQLFIGISYNANTNKLICEHFSNRPGEASSNLSVDVNSAIKLINQEVDPDTLFFSRKLKISGDTEIAHRVKNIIDTLDPNFIPKVLMRFLRSYQQIMKVQKVV